MKTIRKSQYLWLKMLNQHRKSPIKTVNISDEEYEELMTLGKHIDIYDEIKEEHDYPFYWYCGTTAITAVDIERYNSEGNIPNLITNPEDHNGGWRILSDPIGDVWWEGDGLYNYIIFPIDWQRFDDDAHHCYLIIPEGLYVTDSMNIYISI